MAFTGAEAQGFLVEHEFAIALVDVLRPDESGLELIAEILTDHPHLAVVMVSGVDSPRIAELALESGAHGYIVKPFHPNEVLIAVASAGLRRCRDIERRVHEQRLERQIDEQAADLDDALMRLKEAMRHVGSGQESNRS